jgi:hypothetical protein
VHASDDVVRRILEVGRSLTEHGSNNWALTRAQVLVAIDSIEHESRVLLGGDVWLASGNALSPTGDSWHFEPNPERPHSIHPVKRADRASVGRVIEDKTPYTPIQSDSIDQQADLAIHDCCRSEPGWPYCHIIELNES